MFYFDKFSMLLFKNVMLESIYLLTITVEAIKVTRNANNDYTLTYAYLGHI